MDDPALAFQAQPPEAFQSQGASGNVKVGESFENWDAVRGALGVFKSRAVAARLGVSPREVRRWAAGTSQSHDPHKVMAGLIALAAEAGLSLPINDRLTQEAVCAELPVRAAAAQCLVSVACALLAPHRGGLRGIARAMAEGGKEQAAYQTVRRWLSLARGELQPISETSTTLAVLAKLARGQIRAARRRLATDHTPVGDREAIVSYIVCVHTRTLPIGDTRGVARIPSRDVSRRCAWLRGAGDFRSCSRVQPQVCRRAHGTRRMKELRKIARPLIIRAVLSA